MDKTVLHRSVNLEELVRQYKGSLIRDLVMHHLNRQDQVQRKLGITGTLESLPIELQPPARDLIGRWLSRAYSPMFWIKDTSLVLQEVVADARSLVRSYSVPESDEILFRLFNLVVLTIAEHAHDDAEMQRLMAFDDRSPLLEFTPAGLLLFASLYCVAVYFILSSIFPSFFISYSRLGPLWLIVPLALSSVLFALNDKLRGRLTQKVDGVLGLIFTLSLVGLLIVGGWKAAVKGVAFGIGWIMIAKVGIGILRVVARIRRKEPGGEL